MGIICDLPIKCDLSDVIIFCEHLSNICTSKVNAASQPILDVNQMSNKSIFCSLPNNRNCRRKRYLTIKEGGTYQLLHNLYQSRSQVDVRRKPQPIVGHELKKVRVFLPRVQFLNTLDQRCSLHQSFHPSPKLFTLRRID